MSAQSGPPPPRLGDNSDERDLDKLWDDALQEYEDETGKSLRELPVAKNLPTGLHSTDQLIEHFEKQKELFKVFRASGNKVRGVLRPIVDVLLVLKQGAEGASVCGTALNFDQRSVV